MREQFAEEAALGRLSLRDAFAHLAALEPRLRDLPLSHPSSSAGQRGLRVRVSFGDSDQALVGPWANSPHAILKAELAYSVVREYQRAVDAGEDLDQDPTPFFERKKASHGTFVRFSGEARSSREK